MSFDLKDLAVCMKTKVFFLKPGTLILNLYLYDIKIQTDINKNDVEKHAGKS
jgi:hypothetical protein